MTDKAIIEADNSVLKGRSGAQNVSASFDEATSLASEATLGETFTT